MIAGSYSRRRHPRGRGLCRAAAVALLVFTLLQLLPAGRILAAEEDESSSGEAVLQWQTLAGTTASAGKKMENTYILEVSSGTRQGGGCADNVLYFIIKYTTFDGMERTAVLLPGEDALSSGYDIASAQGNREKRIRDVSEYFGYGMAPLRSKAALSSVETDQFLFTTPAKVKSIDQIQVFGKRNPDHGDWSCQGMRVFQVDTLYGLEMYGWYSAKGYIDFDGVLISSVQMAPGGTTFKWRNSAGMYSITPDGTRAKLVNENRPHTTQTDCRLVFRLDLADIMGAGFDSLAGAYAAGSNTKVSALKYCEVAALTIRYADVYGCIREVSLPLMINALGQIMELMGDVALAEFAQQGDSVAIPALLPDFASLTSVNLVMGEDNASKAAGIVTGSLAYAVSSEAEAAHAAAAPGSLRVGGIYVISPRSAPGSALKIVQDARRGLISLYLDTKTGGGDQKWILKDTADGYYQFIPVTKDYTAMESYIYHPPSGAITASAAVGGYGWFYPDHEGYQTTSGTRINAYNNEKNRNQLWKLEDKGGGYFCIVSGLRSDKVLTVDERNTEYGYDIILHDYEGASNQTFRFELSGESGMNVPEGTYTISPVHAPDLYLEMAGGNPRNNGNIQVGVKTDDKRQLWTLFYAGDGYYYVLSGQESTMCLDLAANSVKDGTNVQLYLNNYQPVQRWKLVDAGDGYYSIQSSASDGQCLEVAGGATSGGANVDLMKYARRNNQRWKLTPVSDEAAPAPEAAEEALPAQSTDADGADNQQQESAPAAAGPEGAAGSGDEPAAEDDPSLHVPISGGIFTIRPVHAPGMALEVAGGSPVRGSNIHINTSDLSRAQQWELEDVGNGCYYITSAMDSGLTLESEGESSSDRTNIQLNVKSKTANQQWLLRPFGDGSYVIVSRMESHHCLDVLNSGYTSRTNVQVNTFNRQTNQRWILTNVGGARPPTPRELTVVENFAVKNNPIRSGRVKKSETDNISYVCFAVYREVTVSVALDGATLRTRFTGGSPAQLATATSSEGISATANQATAFSLRPYTEGSALIPRDRLDRYLITISTDNVPNAGTTADVFLQFKYISMKDKELESSEYALRDSIREFYGEWPGSTEEFAYAYGLRDGGTVQFIIPLQGVKEFTGVSVKVSGPDEWQFSGISIHMLKATEDGRPYAARTADWKEINVDGVSGYPGGLHSHLNYTRKVDVYPDDCLTMGTVYEPEEDRPDPEDKDSGWYPGVLVQDDGLYHEFDGETQEVSTKGDVPWNTLRHYMTFQDAQQDLGFTKKRGVYTVGVQVAGNTVNPGNDDCGSKNLFYFRLIFEHGNSGCTLANQQILGDGFRTGDLVQFKIPCAQDYGEVTAIQVIPDSQDSNGDIYDKLQIEYISVTKDTTDAVSPTWTARVASSSDEGWVGIDYRDPGEIASTAGAQGKTLAELATTFPITETSYSTNLLVSITTAAYETGKQFTGGVGMDLNYINAEGRVDPNPISGFDVVGAMNDYGGITGSHERRIVLEDELKTENAKYFVSDKNYQFLPGSTDSFIVNLQNVYQLTDMTLFVYSDVVTQWAIKDVDIYQLRGTGVRYLNASGAYAYRYPAGKLPLKVASWSAERISTPLQVYDSAQDQGIATISFSLDSETIELSQDVTRWSSKILKEPPSKDDTLNLILYPSTGADAANPADYDVTAAIQYTNSVTTQSMQVSTGKMKKGVDSEGRTVFYATGLNASNLNAITSVIWSADSMRNVQPVILNGILQEIRGGVLMDTYPLYGMNNFMYPAVDSPYNSTQRLLLQVSEDTPLQPLVQDESDLAVALYFRSGDPSGLEYRSKYVFLSELYQEVRPGQLLELDYRLGNAGEITGINLVSMGKLQMSIDQTYLANQAKDGTVLWSQSVQGEVTPAATPVRVAFEGSTAPMTLTLVTADDTETASSGTKEPIRMTVGYYDIYGLLKTKTVEDIRLYVQSGGGFSAGSKDTVMLLLPDFRELRWIELEPWHRITESEQLQSEVQLDAGIEPSEDEIPLATWKLRSVTAKVGLDGEDIYRSLDRRILEGEALHIGLSEILLVGNLSYEQTTATPDSEAEPVTETVKLSLSTGDEQALTVESGTEFRIGVRLSGSDDGYEASLQTLDPVTGEPERAYIDETHGYSIQELDALYELANQAAENAPSDSEKALAQAVIDGVPKFRETTGKWEFDLSRNTLVFAPPRNYTGDKITYRLTISSKENPAVAISVDITVRNEDNTLGPALEAWRAVRSAASVTALDAAGGQSDSFNVKFGASHSQLLDSGSGLTIDTHLQDITEGVQTTLRTLDPATGATGPADLSVSFGVNEGTLQALSRTASDVLSDPYTSAEDLARARAFLEVYDTMAASAGSFEVKENQILFKAPRNYTGGSLYYRITVVSGRTGETLFTLDTIVKNEPNLLPDAAAALDSSLRAWVANTADPEESVWETTTVTNGMARSLLLESGGSLTLQPGRNLKRYLTELLGDDSAGNSWAFNSVIRSLDPATGATGAPKLGVTYTQSETQLQNMTKVAQDILSSENPEEMYAAAREVLDAIETIRESGGSFTDGGDMVSLTAPHNYTGSTLYYRIVVTSARTDEELLTADISVLPEENPATSAYNHLQTQISAAFTSPFSSSDRFSGGTSLGPGNPSGGTASPGSGSGETPAAENSGGSGETPAAENSGGSGETPAAENGSGSEETPAAENGGGSEEIPAEENGGGSEETPAAEEGGGSEEPPSAGDKDDGHPV